MHAVAEGPLSLQDQWTGTQQLKGWRREKKIALIEKLNSQWKDLSREWYPKAEIATF